MSRRGSGNLLSVHLLCDRFVVAVGAIVLRIPPTARRDGGPYRASRLVIE